MFNCTNRSSNVLQLQVTRLTACCCTKRCKQHFSGFDVCSACDHDAYFNPVGVRFALPADMNSECLTL